MAPMTRSRATAAGVPTPLMATYYAQRASAGLIVAEMTDVEPRGRAGVDTPGLHTPAQRDGWRRVTDAVHAAGGRIVLQLGHAGRASHPLLQPHRALPIAPSAIRASGSAYTAAGPQPYVTPRALAVHELPPIVEAYANATRLARAAGFDGVELHAGNGYLLDQFLRDGSNRRDDAYGGAVENRARLLLEVVAAASAAWDARRIGVRVSPRHPYNDMRDADPAATFAHVARRLAGRGLAYLHVVEPLGDPGDAPRLTPTLRALFDGPVLVNGGFDAATAEAALARGEADAVSFGAPFIANPDLPRRLALGAPLETPDAATYYGGDARGYTDYPPLAPAARSAA
jgi:N-ethylmaleimide reductase